MADIFLSYASQDKERARDLAGALEAEGWSVFWDRRIPPGRRWSGYIEERLSESRVVVVLWSPHSVDSDWVQTEAAEGFKRKALIPITIAPTKIPLEFRRLQAADLCTWQPGDRTIEYQEVLVEIGRLAPRVHPTGAAPESERLHPPRVSVEAAAPAGTAPAASATTPRPARPALPDELVLPTNPPVHLVKIPAGPFLMGSDEKKDASAEGDELWPGGGQGSVELPDFYVGTYEVTVAQFKACVEEKGCSPLESLESSGLGANADHPVVNVSWDEALQYCSWLEKTVKASPQASPELVSLLASGWHVGLPSEAEWEKAARGTDGRTYPWGEGIDPGRANYDEAKRGGPTPVGSFPRGASPYGILDMSGNVWEWTRSLYKPYPYVASDGRDDLKASGPRVLRGGSFLYDERLVRAAHRHYYVPDYRSNHIGFRVVVSRF